MRSTTRAVCALTAGILAVTLLPNAAVAEPVVQVRDGVTQAAFSYADAIRETVYVEAPVDGDRDGRNDRIVADVIRPRETANGLKVPVIFQASPYFAPAQSAASVDRRRLAGADDGFKDDDDDGVPTRFPEWYDNYFVPRGYAVVQVDMPGTRYSEGCPTLDGKSELAGVKAALDWLDGRAKATTKSGAAAVADWDTGKVGWIGRSHRGTLANMVATMNVPNLKTIIPIDSLATWYPYMRNTGLNRFADYPRWTARSNADTSKLGQHRCDAVIDELAAASDEENGTYNDFWAERDHLADATKVKASVFMVHGLNDWNVTTDHALGWWKALGSAGVQRKLMLTQQAHVDPVEAHREQWVPQIHRWFDYWLQGVPNGIMTEPQVDLERAPGEWEQYPAWPAPATTARTLWFGPSGSLTNTQNPTAGWQTFTDRHEQLETGMIADPGSTKSDRLVLLSAPLTQEMRFSGVPKVTINAQANATGSPLTVLLVDYGTAPRSATDEWSGETGIAETAGQDCFGEGTATDTGCYRKYRFLTASRPAEIVTKATLDTENRDSILADTPVAPGATYNYTVNLLPEDYVFKPGHQIGVVVAGTNCTVMEVPGTDWCAHAPAPGNEPWPRTTFEVNLGKSSVTFPVAD